MESKLSRINVPEGRAGARQRASSSEIEENSGFELNLKDLIILEDIELKGL